MGFLVGQILNDSPFVSGIPIYTGDMVFVEGLGVCLLLFLPPSLLLLPLKAFSFETAYFAIPKASVLTHSWGINPFLSNLKRSHGSSQGLCSMCLGANIFAHDDPDL